MSGGTPSAGARPSGGRRPELFLLAGILLFGALLRAGYLNQLRHAPDFRMPQVDADFHNYWARGLAIGLAYFLSVLPFFAAARYRVPIIPLLLLLAAYGAVRICSQLYNRRWRHAAVRSGLVLAVYLPAAVNWLDYEPDLARLRALDCMLHVVCCIVRVGNDGWSSSSRSGTRQ